MRRNVTPLNEKNWLKLNLVSQPLTVPKILFWNARYQYGKAILAVTVERLLDNADLIRLQLCRCNGADVLLLWNTTESRTTDKLSCSLGMCKSNAE